VTYGSKTLYLTNTTTASTKLADGVECMILGGKIECGADKKGYTYGDEHTSSPMALTTGATNNKNWAIASNNTITWKTAKGEDVNFSTRVASGNRVFAEICSASGHPDGAMFTPGKAKAYFL
jgi:hypothetical protein